MNPRYSKNINFKSGIEERLDQIDVYNRVKHAEIKKNIKTLAISTCVTVFILLIVDLIIFLVTWQAS